MPVTIGAVVELQAADTILATLAARARDLRPAFAEVDRDVTERLREQFATRGATFGTPWQPLAPVTPIVRVHRRMTTAAARRIALANAGADTPLRDSGGLFAAYTKPGAPGSIRIMDQLEYQRGAAYVVNGVPVGALVQSGFTSTYKPVIARDGDVVFVKRTTPKRVPGRPIIPSALPAPVLRAWEGQITTYLDRATGAEEG